MKQSDLVQPAAAAAAVVALSSLSADLLASCLRFLHTVDLCRVGRASRTTRVATDIVCKFTQSLCVAQDAPFLDDGGLSNLLRRCPALVEIDIDARRLSGAGAAAIAEAVPGLTGVTLRNGYGWSGIDFLTNSAARAAGLVGLSRCSLPLPLPVSIPPSCSRASDTVGSEEGVRTAAPKGVAAAAAAAAAAADAADAADALRRGGDGKQGKEKDQEKEQQQQQQQQQQQRRRGAIEGVRTAGGGLAAADAFSWGRDGKRGKGEDQEPERQQQRQQQQQRGAIVGTARRHTGEGERPTTASVEAAAAAGSLSRRRRQRKQQKQQQRQQQHQRQQQRQQQKQQQQQPQQLRGLLMSSSVGCSPAGSPSPLASFSSTPLSPAEVGPNPWARAPIAVGEHSGVILTPATTVTPAVTAVTAATSVAAAAAVTVAADATAAATTTGAATATAAAAGGQGWRKQNVVTGCKAKNPELSPWASRGTPRGGTPRRKKPPLALRSLSLRGFGPSVGLGNPTPEHFEEWSRLAEACAPVLRCLTLTNVSAGQLPICALTPFFKYPRIRSSAAATARGFRADAELCAGRPAGGSGAATAAGRMCYDDDGGGGGCGTEGVGSGSGRGSGGIGGAMSEAAEEGHHGLVELTLATVSSKLAATVLLGAKRPIPLCFRSEGGAAFPGGPRPPLTGLRRLSLVVDDVTDALCLAISEGCPNVREVSLRQKRGQPAAFSDAGPTALATCQQLTSLSINSGHHRLRGCGNAGLVFMVTKLARLEQLSLCGVSRATDATVAAILDHPERHLLQLSLEGCEQLKGLVFFQPLVRTVQSARRLEAMSSLTSISLAHSNAVTPEAIRALTRACGPCLETLDLSYCCVTDEVLMSVLALPGLLDLTLCKCPFTNEGLIAACVAVAGDSGIEPAHSPLCLPRDDDGTPSVRGGGGQEEQSRQQRQPSPKSTTMPTPNQKHRQHQHDQQQCQHDQQQCQHDQQQCQHEQQQHQHGQQQHQQHDEDKRQEGTDATFRQQLEQSAAGVSNDSSRGEEAAGGSEGGKGVQESVSTGCELRGGGGSPCTVKQTAIAATAAASSGVGGRRGPATQEACRKCGGGHSGGQWGETGKTMGQGQDEEDLNSAAGHTLASRPPPGSLPSPHATLHALPHGLPQQQQQQLQQSKQRLKKLSLSGCSGVQGSGLIALLRSGRLGSHTRAVDGTGLSALEDGHVRALLGGMPRLRELRLSGCSLLTRSTVVSIIRSACGSATLSVLELRYCHLMRPTRLTLLRPPSLPALLRLAWWGNDAEAGKMAALARRGNCWVVPGSG